MKKPVGIEPKHYKGMVGEYKKRTVASCICDREIALCMNRLVMIYVMRKMPNQWFDDMDNGQLKWFKLSFYLSGVVHLNGSTEPVEVVKYIAD